MTQMMNKSFIQITAARRKRPVVGSLLIKTRTGIEMTKICRFEIIAARKSKELYTGRLFFALMTHQSRHLDSFDYACQRELEQCTTSTRIIETLTLRLREPDIDVARLVA